MKGAKAAIGDKTELDVLIEYLQVLGTALKNTR
jgi:cytochrome c oxidase cbb3-type subunit 2